MHGQHMGAIPVSFHGQFRSLAGGRSKHGVASSLPDDGAAGQGGNASADAGCGPTRTCCDPGAGQRAFPDGSGPFWTVPGGSGRFRASRGQAGRGLAGASPYLLRPDPPGNAAAAGTFLGFTGQTLPSGIVPAATAASQREAFHPRTSCDHVRNSPFWATWLPIQCPCATPPPVPAATAGCRTGCDPPPYRLRLPPVPAATHPRTSCDQIVPAATKTRAGCDFPPYQLRPKRLKSHAGQGLAGSNNSLNIQYNNSWNLRHHPPLPC